MILSREDGGFIRGFKVEDEGEERRNIFHSLFVDDTFIFCENAVHELRYWRWTVICFELVLNLKINLQKSETVPMGVVFGLDSLDSPFRCKAGSFPTSYLGLPIGAVHNSCVVWDLVDWSPGRSSVCLKGKKRWVGGRRLTLLKSTLSILPIYLMPLFPVPRRVKIRLEEI